MTRVLCVTSSYPPHHLGGYEVSCRDVMDRLVRRGHDVVVLTSAERIEGVETPPGERTANPAVRRDLTRYFRDDDLWAPSAWRRWRIEHANQAALADVLAVFRPEVAAVWHIGALSLGIVTALVEAGLPVVYAISDDWLSYSPKLDQWTKLTERLGPLAGPLRAVARVPTVVPDLGATGTFAFISECTRDRSVEYGRGRYPRSCIVYSGIDRELFTPGSPRGPWIGHLLYVGRFDPRKGIETVIRSLPHLPPETVLEVQGTGSDSERARLDEVAIELGVADRIRFERVSRAELVARYRAADALVFPSEWEEPFGLVPLEAMACATPVVGTGTGGSGEFLVDGANCVRYEAGDPRQLAAAVERLAADPDLRARLVDEGLRTGEYFDVDHLTDAYEGLYTEAASGSVDVAAHDRRFTIDPERRR
jgi:glycosyltransferase involved in cell wall biosynthesis